MRMGQRRRINAGSIQGRQYVLQVLPVTPVIDESIPPRPGNRGRQLETEVSQEADDVSAPARGNRCRAKAILQDKVPADDPSEQFSKRGIAVGVGGTSYRNQGGQLSVAKTRK